MIILKRGIARQKGVGGRHDHGGRSERDSVTDFEDGGADMS